MFINKIVFTYYFIGDNMLNKLFSLFKRIIFAGLLLYTYDSVNVFSRGVIPINFITLLLVTVFGIPALFCLVLFSFLI